MTPVAAIREALLAGKLVGLGEPHWHPDFIRRQHAWLCDPALWGIMTDLVLECGNRHHQGLLDAWLAGEESWQGEPLTLARLYPVWLDSCAFPAWMAPEFPALFAALRQSNLARPEHVRLRVHLCEPLFEWQEMSPELWQQHNRGRDQALADYLLALPPARRGSAGGGAPSAQSRRGSPLCAADAGPVAGGSTAGLAACPSPLANG
ncbi:hypothetical protein [Aeromonas veronii]|uniref:hypothetical protein n=1 Tax=Aeromonas veronii TaxID=654 RepID=UPI002444656F|nr:hypothetical protein [Aeromonas veronii]